LPSNQERLFTSDDKELTMNRFARVVGTLFIAAAASTVGAADAEPPKKRGDTSFMPVDGREPLASVISRVKADKPKVAKRQTDLLNERYDMTNRPAKGVTMFRGKPVQEGVRAKLASGTSWAALSRLSPEEVQAKDLFPAGFLPLPHPNHPEGGMLFPQFHIDEIKKQEGRDLTRFDLDFDLPDHLLPEFPPAIFRRPPYLHDGRLLTLEDTIEFFNLILETQLTDPEKADLLAFLRAS
jgi:cytochrome c peroxidase